MTTAATRPAPARHAPARSGPRLPRLDSLTGLRWWAAFAVFLGHASLFAPIPRVADVATFGRTGVTFFFVLSGFVLTWSHFDGDTAPRFYWRRFARIVPATTVATLVAVPVFYGHGAPGREGYAWGAILLSIALLHAWTYNPVYFYGGNPASWSLSCEMFFYAIFPLLVRRALRRRIRHLAVIAAGVLALMWVPIAWPTVLAHNPGVKAAVLTWPLGTHLAGFNALDIPHPVYRTTEFVLGICVAAAVRRGWRFRVGVWPMIAVLGALVLVLTYWDNQPTWQTVVDPQTIKNPATAPFFALLIAAAATGDIDGKRSFLRTRPMVALGQWSYAYYLVHATVIYAVLLWLPARDYSYANVLWQVVLCAAGVLGAFALYKLVEHPLEAKLRGMLKRPPQRTPVTPELRRPVDHGDAGARVAAMQPEAPEEPRGTTSEAEPAARPVVTPRRR